MQLISFDIVGVSARAVLISIVVLFVIVTGVSALPWLKRRIVAATVIASSCVVVAMWLERWNIIIPTLTHPRLVRWSSYAPSATEWTLTAASFALFILLFLVFFKLVPPVSIWEVAERRVRDEMRALPPGKLPPSSTPSRRRWRIGRRSATTGRAEAV